MRVNGMSENYHHGPLRENALGLDLSGGYEQGTGRGYKTTNGMLLAYALWDQGYSDADVLFAITRMHLMYEVSDFLYDHCGYERPEGLSHAKDVTDTSRQARFKPILEAAAARMAASPDLKRRLIGHVMRMPGLAGHMPGLENQLETSEDRMNQVLLLMGQRLESPAEFDATWKPVFAAFPKEHVAELVQLLDAGVRDVGSVKKGAEFTLEKLEGETPAHAKRMPGIFGYVGALERIAR
jgi:hypothetical protein